MEYQEFLAQKRFNATMTGRDVDNSEFNPFLFDFQKDIVRWAVKRGRACVFADTGLGKSLMQLEWARLTGVRTLILAPLAVAQQTVREAVKWKIPGVVYARNMEQASGAMIVVTNYEMLHHFDVSQFDAVVADESGILKSFSGATRNQIIEAFAATPWKLACTATPAPNDYMELGNHAEFMGVMSRVEMLSMFFVHDGGDTSKWRLKGHAEEEFWKWVATWAVTIQKPSDLGYENAGYDLPPLHIIEHRVDAFMVSEDALFSGEALTLNDQRRSKRNSLSARVERAAQLIEEHADENWLVWCELNDEGDQIEKSVPGMVQVAGADTSDFKAQSMIDFADGTLKRMVSKSSICGFGMNFQVCAHMIFVGVSHSFEGMYQAIRRCWRFGQTRPVYVHLIYAESEGAIVRNLQRKQADAEAMTAAMVKQIQSANGLYAANAERDTVAYLPTKKMLLPSWICS